MNKIYKLFDHEFVRPLLEKKLLPLYPEADKINQIKISWVKKNVWETTYHAVIRFDLTISLSRRSPLCETAARHKRKKLLIFCAAHSNEPRRNVYQALNFLWKHGFDCSYLTVPRPLFYEPSLRAVFYQGVAGNTLYHYLATEQWTKADHFLELAGRWFAKLHSMPTKNLRSFNKNNSRIETILPGRAGALKIIGQRHDQHFATYRAIYRILAQRERQFLKLTLRRWLIHGDAHPENVICLSTKKIALIDYADMCLGDWARDIGAFCQQLDYMLTSRLRFSQERAEKCKEIFLSAYFKYAKVKLTPEAEWRMETYYCLAALRTANYYFLKHEPQAEKGERLLEQLKGKLNIE